jgi:hypothetical protein
MNEELVRWFANQKQPVHLIIRRRPHYLGRKQVEQAIEKMYELVQQGHDVAPRWRVWDIWQMAGHFRPVEGDLDSFEELREEIKAIRLEWTQAQEDSKLINRLSRWMDFAANWPW